MTNLKRFGASAAVLSCALLILSGCGGAKQTDKVRTAFDQAAATVSRGRPAAIKFLHPELRHLASCGRGVATAILSASPMAGPGRAQPLLSRGDMVHIAGGDSPIRGDHRIGHDGLLRLPRMAAIAAQGSDADTLRQHIAAAIGDTSVTVDLVRPAPVKVHVLGAVGRPGTFSLELGAIEGRRNLAVAIAAAGGVTGAGGGMALLNRAGALYSVDISDPAATAAQVISDDVIYVPGSSCMRTLAPSGSFG